MSIRRMIILGLAPLLALGVVFLQLQAQTNETPKTEKPAASKKEKRNKNKKKKTAPALPSTAPFASLNEPGVHEDFPVMCLKADGTPVVVYIENDGEKDTLKLADGQLKEVSVVSAPKSGNIYQPCLTRSNSGEIICVWSELGEDKQWDLWTREISADGEKQKITENAGNDIFADIGTSSDGRVWVVWQLLEKGISNLLAKHRDPDSGEWSDAIQVTEGAAGDWEPRLSFSGDKALVVFDSYRNGNFDVFLKTISPDGKTSDAITLADTSRYEARPEAATSPDGKSLWVAYETGMEFWGKDLGADWRQKGGGLHHDREIKLIRVNLENNEIEKVADVTALLPDLVPDPSQVGTGAIDVPEVVVDGNGDPWVFFRYCLFQSPGFWQIAYAKLDPATGNWTHPEILEKSTLCLDRRTSVHLDPHSGELKVVYPSDLRKNKQSGDTGIYLASIHPNAQRQIVGEMPFDLVKPAETKLKQYNQTPERARDDHHVWEINGEKYTMYWGDVHRHTDFSNCRTTDDGCIVEHFRYALEAGGLDYLGTSDHTEVGKIYSDYEWWQTQKLADLFHNPGSFVSLYAYEREQKFPYGHRNVLFQERGGPLIYIKRKNYSASRWATPLPEPDGDILGDIPPWQLWDLLRTHGQRALTIEHTSSGGMGTDWSKYPKIDSEFETVIELFQGSRQSFEGVGAPQPPIVVGGPQESKFTEREAKGTWQEALRLNHQLGAFASSDHRSTNMSYGGVYVKEFTRKGIFDGLEVRRTTAATDKIYMEFSCNGHLMGEIFETSEKPSFKIRIAGTAPLERITLIRNEEDFHVFTPESKSNDFDSTFTDENPVSGENRYYIRVEQVDGNMGWTSPVWVTIK